MKAVLMFGGGVNEGCLPSALVVADAVLAAIDGTIAALAFFHLLRIQFRNQQLGWTRQKIFHLLIGSSNIGYLIYFTSSLLATCERWQCWLDGCGFILMACPQILFLAAFLLLLSFWVDLCHQAKDEEEDDENGINESFLEKTTTKPGMLHLDGRRRCCSFRNIHVGSRQKFVVLVMLLTFFLMIVFALLIWSGRGENPIDSSHLARAYGELKCIFLEQNWICRSQLHMNCFIGGDGSLWFGGIVQVYQDIFSVAMLFLGGALACYGFLLFSKMRKVRSEMASTEMWKVASLAAVTLLCFTSCSILALVTNIPVLYSWHLDHSDSIICAVIIFLYYFTGSSIPSGFVLWIMRDMPPPVGADRPPQSRVVTFVRETPTSTHNPQWRTTITSSQNKALKASPI